MFRRRQSSKYKYFTRNVSGQTTETFDNTSITGQTWPVSVFDSAILVPDGLAGVAPLHLVKHIAISHWSWSEDIAVYTQGNADQQSFAVVGASAFYIDQLDPAGVPAHEGVSFLNQIGVQATTELDDFPLRIVHRRRFTTMVNQYNAPPAGGFGGGAGEGFGIGAFLGTAANMVPGYGTERSIKRRIRLRPNEAFLWRVEVYDVVTPGGTAADEKLVISADVLGALSFCVVT